MYDAGGKTKHQVVGWGYPYYQKHGRPRGEPEW